MDTFIKRAADLRSLQLEAEGLRALQQVIDKKGIVELRTPQIIEQGVNSLKLEWLDSKPAGTTEMKELGRGLAKLHGVGQKSFGWGSDNFIGLNPQKNTWSDNWGEFFCESRLKPQIAMIGDVSLRTEFISILDRSSLADYLNENCEYSSLVHGDLWSGNVMFSIKGAYLIDPAVYCGDREVDLAMTEMFGGFSAGFYEAYREELGISSEYSKKKVIYNLYHYLNHYNLFGCGYLGGCREGFDFIRRSFS